MWQDVRDYWLPLLLFIGSLAVAVILLVLVLAAPHVIEYLPSMLLSELYAEDATVRRTSIAAAIGLIVTAFVFFRPKGARRPTNPKPHDSMAGA